jgi:hypothetical protein
LELLEFNEMFNAFDVFYDNSINTLKEKIPDENRDQHTRFHVATEWLMPCGEFGLCVAYKPVPLYAFFTL